MSGNRAFKEIANNLSGSDYIKNKKSKEIYKTYRGSPDKINKNVRIEENSLASAESYEMLNLITNGKDITYTMSGGEGTAAISLQNLHSSSDTWKGSLLISEDGKVDLVARSGLVSANLFAHITAGTNTDEVATNGVYHSVPLSGGSGSGAVVTVTVSSSVVSAIAVTAAGRGYAVGDVLTISAGFAGAGSTERTITLQATDLTQSIYKINDPLFLQSIYGTNGTVGCVTEETSQLSFTCCGTAGTATNPQPVPRPTLKVTNFTSLHIAPGFSAENSVSLSQVYIGASYYEYSADPDIGITVSTDGDNVLVALSSQVQIGSHYTVSVTPFNKCRESGSSDTAITSSFDVYAATRPIPTPTTVDIESPIYVTPGSSAYSTVKLSDVFNYATSYVYYVHNADGNQINISTEPDTTIKVEWASGPVLGDNVTITVDVTASNITGTGAATKSFTVKPALPSVSSTNANKTEVTSTTDNKNYVLYTFGYSAFSIDVSAMPEVTGTISIDFSGTTNNTLNSNVLLVAGGAAGGLMQTGLYSNGSVKNGSGGGGAGGYASGQMAITNTNNSTTTYSIGVGNGGKGLIDGSYSTNGNGIQGRDSSITLDGVSVIKVIGGGSGLYTHTNGVGSGGSTGGNSHDVQLKPVETSLSTITGYGNLGGELEFGNLGEPAPERGGGGGGGAGGAGTSGINEPGTDTATRGGNGGIGKEWEINNTFYGGGGGGTGAEDNIIRVGQGGSGGGGTTNTIGNDTGDYNGTNGLGGGGAGGWHNSLYRGDGGSGVCIIAFEKGTIITNNN
jgi:hypothetical protein